MGIVLFKMDRPLKERLTGATILVLIAVLFIPELLSGPAKRVPVSAPAPLLDVPTNAAATVRTYTVDLNHPVTEASAVAASAAEPASMVVHEQPAASSSVQVPVTAASAAETVSPQPAAIAAPLEKASGAAARGASASGASASGASAPAASAPAVASASAPVPAPTAPVALETPATHPQIQAPVVKKPPTAKPVAHTAAHAASPAPAPATFAPIGAKGGWSIQLGSFGNRANAEKLVRSLRSKGIRVYVASQGGKHRVRAGPFPDRTTAERVGARLKSQGQSYTVVAP